MKFNCPPCSILGIVVSASALRKHMWDMGGLTLEMEILGVANWGSLCRLFYSSFSEDIPVRLCFQKISEQKHLLIIDGGHKHLFLVWTERDFPTSHFRMCDLSHYKFGYFFFFPSYCLFLSMYPIPHETIDSQGQSLLVHILCFQIKQTGWALPDVPQVQKDKCFFLWGPSAMCVVPLWKKKIKNKENFKNAVKSVCSGDTEGDWTRWEQQKELHSRAGTTLKGMWPRDGPCQCRGKAQERRSSRRKEWEGGSGTEKMLQFPIIFKERWFENFPHLSSYNSE